MNVITVPYGYILVGLTRTIYTHTPYTTLYIWSFGDFLARSTVYTPYISNHGLFYTFAMEQQCTMVAHTHLTHAHTHAHTHTHTHTCTRTHKHTHTHSHTQTHTHTHTHTHTQTHRHKHTHKHTYAHAHGHANAHAHAHMHTHMTYERTHTIITLYIHTHRHTHTHINTHTRTHTCNRKHHASERALDAMPTVCIEMEHIYKDKLVKNIT